MTDTFYHVDCELTRAVLDGKRNGNWAVMQAAYYSDCCQQYDYKSQHITDCVYAAREKAIADMWEALNDCDENAAVQSMRNFWGI